MGCFSWRYCDCSADERKRDEKRLVIGKKGYLLIPECFGGGHIEEDSYYGYGMFGNVDAYDLAADWNRSYMASHPDYILPSSGMRIGDKPWYRAYADLSLSHREVEEKVEKETGTAIEYRWIGIELSCMNEDNKALPYPLKIAKYAGSVYEECKASKDDPMQGCY